MYQVYCDDTLIFDTRLDELKIFNAKVNLEVNKVGSFAFAIYPSNPFIERLKKMKSIIKVLQKGRVLFRGRILNDVENFNRGLNVTCESDLAFLLDSIQRPFEFSGDPSQLFIQLIEEHNRQVDASKQFKVGNITVTDPNGYIARSDTEYTETLTLINEQLIKTLGGYLNIRYEEDGVYIDYLEDFDRINSQEIEFTKNLIDFSRSKKGQDIATVLIPLGAKIKKEEEEEAKDKEERITIASVNNGLDYIEDQDAIDEYGRIVKKVIFDDVTEPSNLLRKGRDTLNELINLIVSIELKAVDLAGIKKTIDNFRIGSYVKVISPPHGVDDYYLVKKLSIDLFKPSQNKLTLGTTYMTFTESTVSSNKTMGTVINTMTTIENNREQDVVTLENLVYSLINQASNEIVMTIGEKFTSNDEMASIVAEIESQFRQTKESFEFTFNQFNQDLTDVNDATNAKFAQTEKFIRLEDGHMVIGEVGSELSAKFEKDRIVFLTNMKESSYMTGGKLYITDAEILKSIRIGNFAFLPRKNGNLSFKKVV